MTFLLINYEYPPIGGGAATATFHIARQLVVLGHRAIVLTSRFKNLQGASVEEGVYVIRCFALRGRSDRCTLPEMFSFVLSACINLRGVLKRYRPVDAAIVFFAFPCGPIGWLGRLVGHVPYVISLRGGDVPGTEPQLRRLHRMLRPLRRLIYRRSTALVANSDGLRELSLASDPHPVTVIHNGIDTDHFTPAPEAFSVAGPFVFLFVGRFIEQKNLFYLLEQVSRLYRSTSLRFTLSIVGDGFQKKALQDRAKTLQIDGLISWRGWLNRGRLRDVYRSSHCLVLPSLYEGMSNVVLEAMASSLPVIASDVIGNRDLVRHGETGFLFPLDKPEEGVSAMRRLLHDPDLAKGMGQAGRNLVINHFSWKSAADSYARLFESKKDCGNEPLMQNEVKA